MVFSGVRRKGALVMKINNYYVGWTGGSYRTDLMPEPVAPANYRDAEKIAAWREEQSAKRMAAAPSTPFFGRLDRVTVLNDRGEIVCDAEESSAQALMRFLTENFRFPGIGEYYLTGVDGPAQLVGFDLKTALKMAAVEVMAATSPGRIAVNPEVADIEPLAVPLRSWYHRSFCLDPVSMLQASIPGVDVSVIADFFTIAQPNFEDPAGQVIFLQELSTVLDLGGAAAHEQGSPLTTLQQM